MQQVDVFRAAALVVLFLAIVLDPKLVGASGLGRLEVQWALAVAVVLVLLMYDVIVGFILGLALVAVYFRYNMGVLGMSLSFGTQTRFYGNGMTGLMQKYVTPEHLESAQNNVFDAKSLATEHKGVRGVYGEAVYGAQGQDGAMPGLVAEPGAPVA